VLAITSAPAQIDPALRENGVLYFDGNLPTKVTATLNTATTIYLRRDFQMALATLYPGQKIELVGMGPEGYLLKTNYRNNTTTGWRTCPRASIPRFSCRPRKIKDTTMPSPSPSPTKTSFRA
jgi:hypothetical protein